MEATGLAQFSTDLPPIPPALLSRPRRVKLKRKSTGWKLYAIRLFLLPHTLIGIGVLLMLFLRPVCVHFGTDYRAQVTSARYTAATGGEDGNAESFKIACHFTIDGAIYSKTFEVSQSLFTKLGGKPNDSADVPIVGAVTVRVLGRPPLIYGIVYEAGSPAISPFMVCFALFWDGILGVFLYSLYVLPWRMRRLYRNGRVGFGAITRKQIVSGDGDTYYLHYDFQTEDGRTAHAKMNVESRVDFENASERENVIVLHREGKTRPSVLYEYGIYTCVE